MNRYKRALRELRNEVPRGYTSPAVRLVRPALALAGCAALGIVVFSLPVKASAVSLGEVAQAMSRRPVKHTINYDMMLPGREHQSAEIWEADGKVRMGDGNLWVIFDEKGEWAFIPSQKQVAYSEGKHLMAGIVSEGDTLPDLERAIRGKSPNTTVTLSERVENGRRVLELRSRRYFETNFKGQGRKRYAIESVWGADPTDKLPRWGRHYQAVHSENGTSVRMRQVGRSVIDYPEKAPPGTFDVTVPEGWKLRRLPPGIAFGIGTPSGVAYGAGKLTKK